MKATRTALEVALMKEMATRVDSHGLSSVESELVDERTLAVAYTRRDTSQTWVMFVDLIDVATQYEPAQDAEHLARLVLEQIVEPSETVQLSAPPDILTLVDRQSVLWRGLSAKEKVRWGAALLSADGSDGPSLRAEGPEK